MKKLLILLISILIGISSFSILAFAETEPADEYYETALNTSEEIIDEGIIENTTVVEVVEDDDVVTTKNEKVEDTETTLDVFQEIEEYEKENGKGELLFNTSIFVRGIENSYVLKVRPPGIKNFFKVYEFEFNKNNNYSNSRLMPPGTYKIVSFATNISNYKITKLLNVKDEEVKEFNFTGSDEDVQIIYLNATEKRVFPLLEGLKNSWFFIVALIVMCIVYYTRLKSGKIVRLRD